MAISQLSIFVENKPGSLTEITEILADNGVDLRALSMADTKDFGILRLIVSDTDKALAALRKHRCIVTLTDICAVAVPDEPGGLARVLRLLSDRGIGIEYTYAFISHSGRDAYVVLRIEDNERAEAVFRENGIRGITQADINRL